MNRVVVTGIGMVSPLGSGQSEFWRSLISGVSGIGPITLFDASDLPVRIAGEVRDPDTDTIMRRFPDVSKERDRKVLLGRVAAFEALRDAGLERDELNGVVEVGVSLEALCLEDVVRLWHAGGRKGELPGKVLHTLSGHLQTPLDRLSVILAREHRFSGPVYTNCSACAAGAQTIGQAFHLLREGVVDCALAGGADSMINPLGVGGFSLLQALSTENDNPTFACRPFDATRKGTVLSEGAAFVFLESEDRAVSRGAKIYAEVLGYGSSFDAYRVSDPSPNGKGAAIAMRRAIGDAGLKPHDVHHINAHGTGTPKNDVVETLAIKEVFGDLASEIPVTAVKSMTGHMIAASGAVEALVSILSIRNAKIPPIINLVSRDPECDLDFVTGDAREFRGNTVLSNSFGFGGQNASLIFGRWKP
jgi:3-oxoacyl-[acyl-carrier-protein] synthase II